MINLAGGEPDFDTPRHIIDAAYAAMLAGDTHYPPSFGTPALLDAIVAKLARENNVQVKPEQIMVTPGGKWALYATLAATTNPGDEVLILDPAWVSYGPMVQLQRAVPVHVALPSDDDFRITAELLESHITERSKVLMVNSPNNPTGRVLTRDEIDAIVKVATEHDLYVISDEIYEHILYDDAVHYSLAAEPGMAERTIIINGFSKGYAMTGWRLGWLAGPQPITKLARTLQTQSITSAASFTMAAGVAALNGPQECVHEMTAAYAARRRFVLDALEEIPGIECPPVEGAFYVFPKFTRTTEEQPGDRADPARRSADRHHAGHRLRCSRRRPHPLQHRHFHGRSGEDGGAAGADHAEVVKRGAGGVGAWVLDITPHATRPTNHSELLNSPSTVRSTDH